MKIVHMILIAATSIVTGSGLLTVHEPTVLALAASVPCAIPPPPDTGDRQICLGSSQMAQVRQVFPWLVDPSPIVARVTGMHLQGMLLEYQHNKPFDVLFAYGSAKPYWYHGVHYERQPRFVEMSEGRFPQFPHLLLFSYNPNGSWAGQGTAPGTNLSFTVWSNVPTHQVKAIGHAMWTAITRGK